jgi:predicted transcriptional regulator
MYETRRSHVALALLDYLWKNRQAQDTLQGIAQWWLPQQQLETTKSTLKAALAELVGKKLILESKGKDAQIHYRLNPRKLRQVAAMLNEPSA